jgi:hypothetical protein
MSAHHHVEHAEHTEHISHSNKRIALLIAVIALFLAFSETLGKSAQTAAISYNVEASNLWAFYQAKTIRQTVLGTAAETRLFDAKLLSDSALKTEIEKQIENWRASVDRYESEPKPTGGEGRRELSARAVEAQKKQETAMARYHHYELASAAFQIAIVLCSAAVVTSMIALAYIAAGLGVIGLAFTAIGLLAPNAVHLF